jgi:hypothetical protein
MTFCTSCPGYFLLFLILFSGQVALAHPEPVLTNLRFYPNGLLELTMTGEQSRLPILSARVEAQIFPDPGSSAGEGGVLVLKGATRLERVNFVDAGQGKYSAQLQPLKSGRYLFTLVDSTFGGENAVTAHRMNVGTSGGNSSALLPKTATPINWLWFALGGLGLIVTALSSVLIWQSRRPRVS